MRAHSARAVARALAFDHTNVPPPRFTLPALSPSDYLSFGVTAALILFIAGLASLAAQRPLFHVLVATLAAGVAVAVQAWAIDRRHQAARQRAEVTSKRIEQEADARVLAVTRQFRWAVEDSSRLGRELREVRRQKRAAISRASAARRRVREVSSLLQEAKSRMSELSKHEAELLDGVIATGMPESVQLFWGIHDEGMIRWLQVEGGSWDTVPSRVRVVDEAGHTVAISYHSLSSRIDEARSAGIGGRRGLASMVFQVPDYVIEALIERSTTYRFQALVEDEWWPANMIDTGSRSAASAERRGRLGGRRWTDKRGRVYVLPDRSLEGEAEDALASP